MWMDADAVAVLLKAMFAAFERGNEPTDLDIATSMNSFVPLSKLMAEQIEAHALKSDEAKLESGRQEFLENLINEFI